MYTEVEFFAHRWPAGGWCSRLSRHAPPVLAASSPCSPSAHCTPRRRTPGTSSPASRNRATPVEGPHGDSVSVQSRRVHPLVLGTCTDANRATCTVYSSHVYPAVVCVRCRVCRSRLCCSTQPPAHTPHGQVRTDRPDITRASSPRGPSAPSFDDQAPSVSFVSVRAGSDKQPFCGHCANQVKPASTRGHH